MGDAVSISFISPAGEELRFDFSRSSLQTFDPSGRDRTWALAGELDWDEVGLIRVLSARFEDGRALAIAALRPVGAGGHGGESIAGLLLSDSESVERLDQVLISTEADGGGEVRRVGLELGRESGTAPIRIAGETTSSTDAEEARIRDQRFALRLRANGTAGVGALDILRLA